MVTETHFLGKKYKTFQSKWSEEKRKFLHACMMYVYVCVLLLCALILPSI